MTGTRITPGQRKQFRQVMKEAVSRGVNLALQKVETDQDGWQRVLEHGDEIRTAMAEAIVDMARRISVSDFPGWETVVDVGPVQASPLSLVLFEFLGKGESYVSGEEMLERAQGRGNPAGQDAAEYLCKNPDQIPEEWRHYVLIFPGTVLRDPLGNRYVSCLMWSDEELPPYLSLLNIESRSNFRMVHFGTATV